MRRILAAVAVVLVGAVGRADAKWPHHQAPRPAPNPTPGFVPGAAGRLSFAGVPGLGAPVATRAALGPVIGSERRTGHFVHPVTGRTRYTGTEYNPLTGRFGTYHVRR